ncbi:protein KTI12 homolog [Malurus melanocephalus]|uniref:protein KTI12 homolog n=1 Tax=Malurus melanocephalus TaxID=175006 RepID=UPI0025482CF6|nr:protein KTI12 homolog [Malurus melanocephalus]
MNWGVLETSFLISLRAKAGSRRSNHCCDGVFEPDACRTVSRCQSRAVESRARRELRGGGRGGPSCAGLIAGVPRGRGGLCVCVTGGSSRAASGSGVAGGAMPLVVLCGRPGSGKSRRAAELREALGGPERPAHVVAQAEGGRSALRAEVERRLSRRDVVIVDAGNELRSIRYELYCAARQAGTARCVLHCAGGAGGPDEPTFEEPDPSCRWDRPLFTVCGEEPLPLGAIRAALFESAPPPPHRATRTQPLQSCGFLHQLDRVTQDVLAAVLAAQRSGAQPGETIRVPGVAEGLVLSRPVSVAELSRLRRQFISYTKMQPSDENMPQLASMFLQYLSRSIQ